MADPTKSAWEKEAAEISAKAGATDCEHWARAAHWSTSEAVALWIGVDPPSLRLDSDWQDVSFGSGLIYEDYPNIKTEFLKRCDLVRREFGSGEPSLNPVEFAEWAKVKGLPIPAMLESSLATFGVVVRDLKTELEALHDEHDQLLEQIANSGATDSPQKPERDSTRSYQKLLLALVIEHLRYIADPNVRKQDDIGVKLEALTTRVGHGCQVKQRTAAQLVRDARDAGFYDRGMDN